MPGLGTYTGRIVAEVFATAGVPLTPAMSTNYLETIGMLVGTGLGWSVLPASVMSADLVSISTDAPPLHRALGLVTHPKRTLSNAAQAFTAVALEHRDPDSTNTPARDSALDDA